MENYYDSDATYCSQTIVGDTFSQLSLQNSPDLVIENSPVRTRLAARTSLINNIKNEIKMHQCRFVYMSSERVELIEKQLKNTLVSSESEKKNMEKILTQLDVIKNEIHCKTFRNTSEAGRATDDMILSDNIQDQTKKSSNFDCGRFLSTDNTETNSFQGSIKDFDCNLLTNTNFVTPVLSLSSQDSGIGQVITPNIKRSNKKQVTTKRQKLNNEGYIEKESRDDFTKSFNFSDSQSDSYTSESVSQMMTRIKNLQKMIDTFRISVIEKTENLILVQDSVKEIEHKPKFNPFYYDGSVATFEKEKESEKSSYEDKECLGVLASVFDEEYNTRFCNEFENADGIDDIHTDYKLPDWKLYLHKYQK